MAARRRPTSSNCTRCSWRLLTSALESTAPGGVVGYVTCSPHRRETADVVEQVLAGRSDVELLDPAELLPELPRRRRRSVPAAVAAPARHRRHVRAPISRRRARV